MSAYLSACLAAAGVFALLTLLSPEDREIEKSVKLVLSLLLILFAVSPLFRGDLTDSVKELFSDHTDTAYDSAEGEEWMTEKSRAAFIEGVKTALVGKFSLDADDVSVSVTFSEGITPESVTVTLSGNAVFADLPGIRRYGKENFTEEFEVILHIGS